MRILSDFHDYYDCVQAIDLDRELIYHRKVTETKSGSSDFPVMNSFYYGNSISYESFIIGFCNKVYPLLKICASDVKSPLKKYEPTFCCSLNELDNLIKNNYREKEFDSYCAKKKQFNFKGKYWSYNSRRECFEKFFNDCAEKQDKYKELFLDHPLFVVRHLNNRERIIEYNACLKDYEFQRIKDTYSAWTEISMHVGNIAKPEKPIPHNLTDEEFAEIKGFNKFSFRKDKKDI